MANFLMGSGLEAIFERNGRARWLRIKFRLTKKQFLSTMGLLKAERK